MIKFALKRITAITGKQVFEKLIIDGYCQFDDYENNIKSNRKYFNELKSIYTYMEEVSNLRWPPESKYKDITPQNEIVKEYEFKSKHLRVYAIKKENGKIIIIGGYKNSQKKDIKRFRAIKQEYMESIK